ncbi:carbohydrate sulfotransferase 11-like isoform X2 [Mercenaria mercenaria]|nr:carbohydrate sulfotransferase 11-like isoform X2 [Mercenaria mercenaria]XP_053375376.1 carbohydrate sulfotransferase 11-like isoform X2 [Mercenaria mercenaria]
MKSPEISAMPWKTCSFVFIGITAVILTLFCILQPGINVRIFQIYTTEQRLNQVTPFQNPGEFSERKLQKSSIQPVMGNVGHENSTKITFEQINKIQEEAKMHSVAEAMKTRFQVLQEKCEKHLKNLSSFGIKGSIYSIQQKINYCETPKVGCTFWKSVMRFLAGDYPTGRQIQKPSDIDRAFVHSGPWKNIKRYGNDAVKLGVLSTGYNIMFVREPYSRLWSGYLDKFYLPDFWQRYGPIFRHTSKKDCIQNISFEEFLTFIAENHHATSDMHWTPFYQLCNPCHVKYDVIGKMETFSNDSKFILNKLGHDMLVDDKQNNSKSRAKEEIRSLSKYNFSFKNNSCFFHEVIAKRLWSVFQMNGYIQKNIPFPLEMFSDKNFYLGSDNTTSVFIKYAFKALDSQTVSDHDLKEQKHQYMIDGYSTIPMPLLYRIQKQFQIDFELFGYNAEPAEIFSRQFVQHYMITI